ncbi:hypothetical protein N1F89_04980 [Aquibium sp. A9E412]|uniref:hypothetical protein n=1 Tax=Aquibium sp. A9E412 TaxID=2976767 RepID=UPI0025B1B06E|nr:hypothetical protein [Aquibium sp. A9E412]MDN2565567.1 hypothetical protein [Aquibium sp. A9E412]
MTCRTKTTLAERASAALAPSAADTATGDALVKRIRKLRWIGMEAEARALERRLRPRLPAGPVLTGRFDTD